MSHSATQTSERKVIVTGVEPEDIRSALGTLGISGFEIDEVPVPEDAESAQENEPDVYVTTEQLERFMQENDIHAGQFKMSVRYLVKVSNQHLSPRSLSKNRDENRRLVPLSNEEFEIALQELKDQGIDIYELKGDNRGYYAAYYLMTESGPIQTLKFDPETRELNLNMSGLQQLSEIAKDPRKLGIGTGTDSFVRSTSGQLFMGAANLMLKDS